MNTRTERDHLRRRRWALWMFFVAVAALLAWRALHLQVFNQAFLQSQADARHLREVKIPAHRGMVLDRNGEPMAISTPVDSVWADPREAKLSATQLSKLAAALGERAEDLQRSLEVPEHVEFVYLQRQVSPEAAKKVRALNLPGVRLEKEYRRYYPTGEVSAHIVGFTDINDVGQEGLELAYNGWLQGQPGAKLVVKDGNRRTVADVESIQPVRPGRDLALSIDRRIQYLAYRQLKAAVRANKAKSGSVVILDVHSGEVLAMVNQPSFNPNRSKAGSAARRRNRAVTDPYEPGSTIKPFIVAAGLASGKYRPRTKIDTAPGLFRVGSSTIRDLRDYGRLDVTGVITKSSNIGASKIALSLPAQRLWSDLHEFGFGRMTNSGFPGESSGSLPNHRSWRKFEQATIGFGYRLSVTPLQLARAYAMLGAEGVRKPISFVKLDRPPVGVQVLPAHVAAEVRSMLQTVVGDEGTGAAAQIPNYQVAGKTGTARKATVGGYARDRYVSLFAGLAPASQPRLAMVVVIDEPRAGRYYGGEVAAPVFAEVMSGALRLLNVAPDALPLMESRWARSGDDS